jgi:hypothetical protein
MTDLSARTIGELNDGRAGALIDAQLEQALNDCYDRPMLNKSRTLTINLTFTPHTSDIGQLEVVTVEVEAKATIPKKHTRPEVLKVSIEGDDAGVHVKANLPRERQMGMFEEGSGHESRPD